MKNKFLGRRKEMWILCSKINRMEIKRKGYESIVKGRLKKVWYVLIL